MQIVSVVAAITLSATVQWRSRLSCGGVPTVLTAELSDGIGKAADLRTLIVNVWWGGSALEAPVEHFVRVHFSCATL